MLKLENIGEGAVRSAELPRRRGVRPKTIRAPLHLQCNGHGNPKHLNELTQEIQGWPDIESNPAFQCPAGYVIDLLGRKSGSAKCEYIYRRKGNRSCTSRGTNSLLGSPIGNGSLGDCSRMGRAPLSRIPRIDAGRRSRPVYTPG